MCGRLRERPEGSRWRRRQSPGSEERGRLVPPPLGAFRSRDAWLVFGFLRPVSQQAGHATASRGREDCFGGMAGTFQGLFYKDSDSHGFLGVKGKERETHARWTRLLSALLHFSKCFLAGHCAREPGFTEETS